MAGVRSTTLEIVLRGKDLTAQAFQAAEKNMSKTESAFLRGSSVALRGVQKLSGGLALLGSTAKLVFFDVPNRVIGAFIGLVKTATLTVGGLTAALGVSAVKIATDFETSLAKLRSVSAFRATLTDDIRVRLQRLSAETGQSFESLSASLGELGDVFNDSEKALLVLEIVSKAATGTFSEQKAIVDSLVTSMSAFGAESGKAEAFLNVLLAGADVGKAGFASFAEAMAQSSHEAALLGLSFEDTSAIVAALSLRTRNASEAASQFEVIVRAILTNREKIQKIADIGLLGRDPAAFVRQLEKARDAGVDIVEVFGGRSAGAILGLVDNVQQLEGALRATAAPAFTIRDRFTEAADTVGVKFSQIKQSVLASLGEIGTQLLPTIKTALDTVNKFFRDNEQEVRNFGETVAFVVQEVSAFVRDAARIIGESELFKGSFLDGLKRAALVLADFIINAAQTLVPDIAKLYFAIGKTAVTAFVGAVKQFAIGDLLTQPIEDAIRRSEQLAEASRRVRSGPEDELRKLYSSAARDSRVFVSPEFQSLRFTQERLDEQLADLKFLRDEMKQTDTRLLGIVGTLRDVQREIGGVGEAFKQIAVDALKVSGDAGKNLLGEEAWQQLEARAGAAAAAIGGFDATLNDASAGTTRFWEELQLLQRELDGVSLAAGNLTGTGNTSKSQELAFEDLDRNSTALAAMAAAGDRELEGIRTRTEKAFAEQRERTIEALRPVEEVSRRVADSIAGSFDSAFDRIVDGTFRVQDAFRNLAVDILRSFQRTASGLLGESIFKGLFGTGIGAGTGLFANLFGGLFGAGGGGAAAAVAPTFGNPFSGVPTTFGAAAGGVFGGGFLPFRTFGSGGIATRPTLGLIAEAGMNEAAVPLPDGRRIPVDMGGGAGGTTVNNITINVSAIDGASVANFFASGEAERAVLSVLSRAQGTRNRFGGR